MTNILLTPALSSGLLPGTFRAHLLEQGLAREATLTLKDITENAEWYLGNSVRELNRSILITGNKSHENQ